MKKIIHDRPNCIGCGACVAVAPKLWEMKEDGKSSIIDCKHVGDQEEKEVEEFGLHMDAAQVCPVNVIHLFDENGKKLI